MPVEEKKERKKRSVNRKLEQLTLNEQRSKLLRKLSKFKGVISRNKTRYEAITPQKILKNKDMEQTKADYKKKYEDADSKRLEVSTLLKEIDKNIKEAKKLKSEGKDTSHLNVKLPGKRGRPKLEDGSVTYKTTITPGAPLVKNDFINEEWRQSMKMRFAIEKLQKDNKQIDDIVKKAKKAGTAVHGIDEEEYDRITKEINKLTKEREAFMNVIRKRVGKENIITKVAIVKETKEKKAKGRPKKEKPIVEKKPRGRPKKPVVVKLPRGRPKKNDKLSKIDKIMKDMNKEDEEDMQRYNDIMKLKLPKNYKSKINKLDKIMKDMDKADEEDMQRYNDIMRLQLPKKSKIKLKLKDYKSKINKLDKIMKDMDKEDDDDIRRYAKLYGHDMEVINNNDGFDDIIEEKVIEKLPKKIKEINKKKLTKIVATKVLPEIVEEIIQNLPDKVSEVVDNVIDEIPKHIKIMNPAHKKALLAQMKAKREEYERFSKLTFEEIREERDKKHKAYMESDEYIEYINGLIAKRSDEMLGIVRQPYIPLNERWID